MSNETSRILSALAIAVAIIVAAWILRPERYQSFSEDQGYRSIFDRRTGLICFIDLIAAGDRVFVGCAPAVAPGELEG